MNSLKSPIPMARLFSLFVVLGLAVLGLSLGLLSANGLNSAFERQLNRIMAAHVEANTQLLQRYVTHQTLALTDLADNPVIVQGVMQPETGLPNAIEFLDSVQIMGKRPRLVLFDFQGRVLYDTARHETCLPSSAQLAPLLQGQTKRFRQFMHACQNSPHARPEPILRIVSPIHWRGNAEGLLAADFPISQVGVLREINQGSHLESLSLLKDGVVIFAPEHTVQGLQEQRSIPELGVTLSVSMDLSGVHKERKTLLLLLAGAVLVLVLFFGFLAVLAGNRLFVHPLRELRRRADMVRCGEMPPPVRPSPGIQEIATLDTALQDMANEVLAKQRQLQEQIREREQVAHALRQNEKLLADTGRTAQVGGWQFDQQTGELTWTEETRRIHEAPAEYTPALDTALAFYPPESQAVLFPALERLQQHDEPYDLELEMVTAQGARLWVRTIGEKARDAERPGLITGIIQDITARKNMELALRESEEFNKRIIESSPDCIKVLDSQARLRYMNPGGQKLMCIPDLTEYLGMYYPDILPHDLREHAESALNNARQGRTSAFQASMSDLECRPHWWSVSVTPLLGADGELQRFLVVSRDVSSLKQAEEEQRKAKEQALAASKAKSEFLANMSHEIRTPMNGILGMAQLLADTPMSREQQESLQTIVTSAHTLLQLINDILDLSKIEASKMELHVEPFSMATLLREITSTVGPQAAKKGLELSWNLHEDVPAVLAGDLKRLRQVCVNLAGNAVKFTEQGSVSIDVALEKSGIPPGPGHIFPGCQIRFAVSDTGIGIPLEQQEKIFESFSQADGSATRSYGGTGLGLSISRRLVELMGGSMQVQSAPGQGSTFSFSAVLQVAPDQYQPLERTEHDQTFTAWGLLILVVDDNQINRLVAQRMLERTGNTVHLATSGSEALELLQANNYSLVLMDVQMPGMDGLQATALIRQSPDLRSPNNIYIVAMTAHAMKGDKERFLQAGMNDYLAKPLSMENLQDSLRRFVELSLAEHNPNTPPLSVPLPDHASPADLGGTASPADLGGTAAPADPADLGEQADQGGAVPPARPEPERHPELEREAALARFAGDEELYAEAVADYLENSPAKFETIAHALQNKEYDQALLQAHSLKGNSATIGARRCAERAEELEQACRNHDDEKAMLLLRHTQQAYEAVARLLG